jgi:3-hydroxyacyl-CoA dehydrogenase/enoyl-CoA hydratase/3-hydroxybutyryl-CoA epimerase
MHYFSPVHRMPLLEIITTEKTAKWVTATAIDFGIRQGKTCIVVKDGPGFYTTRILAPMLNEAVLLVEEGAEIQDIDRAMLGFGYPVGPMALLDEVGIDVGAHVTKSLGTLFEARDVTQSNTIPMLFEKGYLGKKNKKGFYRYDIRKKGSVREANKDIYRLVGGIKRKHISVDAIQGRLSLMMINEALLCLQEGIVSSPRDGDVGAILGLGFPPFRGGPFRYIDHVGTESVLKKLEDLRKVHGNRYKPAELLVEMEAKGKRFYPI